MATAGPCLPVCPAQEALWLLHHLDPTSAAYHTGAAVVVHAPLEVGGLVGVLDSLAARHDMVRSTFHEHGGAVVRQVHPRGLTGPVILPTSDDTTPREQLGELAVEVLNRPFLLSTGAFRFGAFPVSGGAWMLVMAAHHIATDARSNWILLRDLFADYAARIGRSPVPRPAPAQATYQDFVGRQGALLAADRRRPLEDHWRTVCDGAVAAEVPLDRTRRSAAGRGSTHVVRFSPAEARLARTRAAALEVTPFSCLLGTFQALVARRGRQHSFLVGCPVSIRTGAGTREVVGNYVNTLLFRADVGPTTTLADLAGGAHRQVASGLRASAYPFALLPRILLARSAAFDPLCRLTFNLVGTTGTEPFLNRLLDPWSGADPVGYAGLELEPLPLPQSEGQLDLAVHVQVGRDSLTAEFRYDTTLFDRSTVVELAEEYRRLLRRMLTQPHWPALADPVTTGRPGEQGRSG